MSDAWRIKKYYDPRVLISVSDVLQSDFPDSLVCLTGAQLNILRNLMQYAERRSTWVSEYGTDHYLAPTNEEWDNLQGIVAELEETLMGCSDIVTQLACICTAIQGLQAGQTIDPNLLPEGQPYFDNEDSSVEEGVGDPPVSPDWEDWEIYRCKGAQMIVDDVIDIVTNWAEIAADVGLVTFALLEGTLIASLVGIPAAVLGAIASFLLTNLTDFVWTETVEWIYEHKQGLVCAIVSASTSAAAKAAVNAYIADQWNKLWANGLVKLVFTRHTLAQLFEEALPSYASREGSYSSGYCYACEEPEVGDDWFAVRYAATPYENTAYVPPHSGWMSDQACSYLNPIDGHPVVGVVWTCIETPEWVWKHTVGTGGDCDSGHAFTPNAGNHHPVGQWWLYTTFKFNDTQAKAALCPAAPNENTGIYRGNVDDVSYAMELQCNNIEGTATYRIDWVVYEGLPD